MRPHVQLSCLFNLFQSGTASQSLLSFMTLTFEKSPGQSSPVLDVRVSFEDPSDSQPLAYSEATGDVFGSWHTLSQCQCFCVHKSPLC